MTSLRLIRCRKAVFFTLPSSFPFCHGLEAGGKIHKPPQEVVLMTEEQKNVIIKCRNSGLGYATIAKDIGLTKDAVVAFCRRNGLTGNMAGKAQDTAGRCRECGAALSPPCSRSGHSSCRTPPPRLSSARCPLLWSHIPGRCYGIL